MDETDATGRVPPEGATVVIPTSSADADPFLSGVYLFFAPSAANNFPGFGGWV